MTKKSTDNDRYQRSFQAGWDFIECAVANSPDPTACGLSPDKRVLYLDQDAVACLLAVAANDAAFSAGMTAYLNEHYGDDGLGDRDGKVIAVIRPEAEAEGPVVLCDEPDLDPTRECGPCSACCEYGPRTDDGRKPVHGRCAYLREGRCADREGRPPGCHEFYCEWRHGLGSDDDRPDRLGVVFQTHELGGHLLGIDPVLWKAPITHAWAKSPALRHDRRVSNLLDDLGRDGAVLFMAPGYCRMVRVSRRLRKSVGSELRQLTATWTAHTRFGANDGKYHREDVAAING